MYRIKVLLAIVAICSGGTALPAAEPNLPRHPSKPIKLGPLEVYEKVLKTQAKQQYLQCNIIREEVHPSGASPTAQPQSVSGTLKVGRSGKAWLEMTVPSRQLAVSDGKTLWVQMDDAKQVMKYDAAQLKQGGNFFLDLGSSIRYYAKNSLKRLILPGPGFDEKNYYALELMPLKPESAGFDRMRVWVDSKEWLVRQVELKLGGVETRVRFEDMKLEGAADPALFKYKAPKGYEVFDLAGMQ